MAKPVLSRVEITLSDGSRVNARHRLMAALRRGGFLAYDRATKRSVLKCPLAELPGEIREMPEFGILRASIAKARMAESTVKRPDRRRRHALKKPPIRGFVYFIRAENGLTKVGKASSLKSRLQSLQTMSPVRLTLRAFIPASRPSRLESELHERLKDFRSHGEWFDLPESEFQSIAEAYEVVEETG